jgi:hypothetical protein
MLTYADEHAHEYTGSKDGKYIYAVERELNSLAIFKISDEKLSRDTDGAAEGARRLDIVDRLAEGQDRLRWSAPPVSPVLLKSNAVCGLTSLTIRGEKRVVAASGCQLLTNYTGDTSNRTCISDACNISCCDALQQGLVGHWELSQVHMYGRHEVNPLIRDRDVQSLQYKQDIPLSAPGFWTYHRAKITRNTGATAGRCSEVHDTAIGPSTIRDLTGKLGAAIFRGAGLFCKKDTTAQELKDWDKPPYTGQGFDPLAPITPGGPPTGSGESMTAATFIMNNGELEAMQFDGKLNLGLLVAENVNEVAQDSISLLY